MSEEERRKRNEKTACIFLTEIRCARRKKCVIMTAICGCYSLGYCNSEVNWEGRSDLILNFRNCSNKTTF